MRTVRSLKSNLPCLPGARIKTKKQDESVAFKALCRRRHLNAREFRSMLTSAAEIKTFAESVQPTSIPLELRVKNKQARSKQ